FNIALAPFKIPFRSGIWKKNKDKINITFSNKEEFEIPHDSKKAGAFPSQIILKDIILKPDFCENLDWSQLPENIESSSEMGFYCSEKEPNINIFINFKKNTFLEFTGDDTLISMESFFLNTPSDEGVYEKKENIFTFHTSHGLERKGNVTKWESGNKIPQIIEFGSGKEAFEVERNNCPWMEKSIRKIPLVTAKNILCEKKDNDLVISILPNQKINIYFKTSDFSLEDFLDDKFTIQGTDLTFEKNIMTFKNKQYLVKGYFEKEGEKIKSIKIPKGENHEELEYSREFCPVFYLTDKLWK
ncbi:MAG: hypothetical protein ACHQYQ_09950, partial [Bacteriovoracales bacterium]